MRRFAEVFILTALVASGCTVAWVSAQPASSESSGSSASSSATLAKAPALPTGEIAHR